MTAKAQPRKRAPKTEEEINFLEEVLLRQAETAKDWALIAALEREECSAIQVATPRKRKGKRDESRSRPRQLSRTRRRAAR